MFNIYSVLGLLCGLICISVSVAVSSCLPGAAVYLGVMAMAWFGIAVYGRLHA
jgi:hypothetical protein